MSTADGRLGPVKQVVAFRLDGRLFGVDIHDVREVNEETSISRIHHAPDHVSGYLNIRGQIHLVVDLREQFGLAAAPITPASRVVIFKNSVDEPFGILVDAIEDIIEIDAGRIVDASSVDCRASTLEAKVAGKGIGRGVYPLARELLMLLDAHSIIAREGK